MLLQIHSQLVGLGATGLHDFVGLSAAEAASVWPPLAAVSAVMLLHMMRILPDFILQHDDDIILHRQYLWYLVSCPVDLFF